MIWPTSRPPARLLPLLLSFTKLRKTPYFFLIQQTIPPVDFVLAIPSVLKVLFQKLSLVSPLSIIPLFTCLVIIRPSPAILLKNNVLYIFCFRLWISQLFKQPWFLLVGSGIWRSVWAKDCHSLQVDHCFWNFPVNSARKYICVYYQFSIEVSIYLHKYRHVYKVTQI